VTIKAPGSRTKLGVVSLGCSVQVSPVRRSFLGAWCLRASLMLPQSSSHQTLSACTHFRLFRSLGLRASITAHRFFSERIACLRTEFFCRPSGSSLLSTQGRYQSGQWSGLTDTQTQQPTVESSGSQPTAHKQISLSLRSVVGLGLCTVCACSAKFRTAESPIGREKGEAFLLFPPFRARTKPTFLCASLSRPLLFRFRKSNGIATEQPRRCYFRLAAAPATLQTSVQRCQSVEGFLPFRLLGV
jgi:hypothetical protein